MREKLIHSLSPSFPPSPHNSFSLLLNFLSISVEPNGWPNSAVGKDWPFPIGSNDEEFVAFTFYSSI
jgi:hypothetical protein